MKKVILIILGILVLGGVWLAIRGPEDTWILDKKGVWVKHGVPRDTPEKVVKQQALIEKAKAMFDQEKAKGTDFSAGPCFGLIESDWVLDIAHSPREEIDNQSENQCEAYRKGEANHFIELDPNGKIIQIR